MKVREVLSKSWYACGYTELAEKQRNVVDLFLEDNKDFIHALYEALEKEMPKNLDYHNVRGVTVSSYYNDALSACREALRRVLE